MGHTKQCFHMCKSKKEMVLTLKKSKSHFFSSDKREKTKVLRGYCRDKGPKLYIRS